MGERKGTKALELWCKRLVRGCPNVQIENMTTSWRNGMAFCALVHHFRPDLIDMSVLKPENIYDNNQLAFSIAEKHLGIPALLDPEDMVANDVPDRLSILTYLSQFYQRLGHTVSSKSNENESSSMASQPVAVEKFGKSALDKCASCDLPVYLAQRLIVSQKLYHRRCFRCSKCSGHLNPNNFKNFVGTEFICDSCKNNKSMSKFLNNNDVQMGMLEFSDNLHQGSTDNIVAKPLSDARRPRPQSILDKINMFEKSVENTRIDYKLESLTLKDDMKFKNSQEFSSPSSASTSQVTQNTSEETHEGFPVAPIVKDKYFDKGIFTPTKISVYKSDEMKNSFLKSQLLGDAENDTGNQVGHEVNSCLSNTEIKPMSDNIASAYPKQECNVTDDTRLAHSGNPSPASLDTDLNKTNESRLTIPPRRKKRPSTDIKTNKEDEKTMNQSSFSSEMYPDHLNPFSEDEEEEGEPVNSKLVSTNPFSSSDDDAETAPEPPTSIANKSQADPPVKRLIAVNPFWSDGEEPTTDEDEHHSSSMCQSSLTTSTPNRQSRTQRRKAPPPPPPALASGPLPVDRPSASMEDVASLSSVSSFNSTIHSDQKSQSKLTPMLKKRLPAPTPPDSVSTLSGSSLHGCGGSMEKGVDTSGLSRRAKGPAPGLPLPARREVRLQLSPAELQLQLDLLETQQLGLEKQGVLIEQMIRDKCEGDEASPAPQEEVEDLVIQLCELVNEKNDLFRKQTELMYIRRQQRLEQEQADIEHEIRVIQSRPAVNRIDADKAREEQLVSRLVEIVRLRDELVQQLDAERRRERQEDLAIAASIASKRAQRNSESNSSSMKSEVATTPKKNKVKDKMKKQFKKAKHTLISKKKDGSSDKKEEEKEKRSKTSPKNKTEV